MTLNLSIKKNIKEDRKKKLDEKEKINKIRDRAMRRR